MCVMPWRVDAYRRSERVRRLSAPANLAYRQLLETEYVEGGILPDDLERAAGFDPAWGCVGLSWPEIWSELEQFFELGTDGRYRNDTCEAVRREAPPEAESRADRKSVV